MQQEIKKYGENLQDYKNIDKETEKVTDFDFIFKIHELYGKIKTAY